MIRTKQRIYLEIETKKREFFSRCYFALKAANKGFCVVIGKKNKLHQNLEKLENGHYIFKSAGLKTEQLAPKFKNLKFIPYAFDEEGGIIISPLDTSRRVLSNALNQIEKYFSWGNDERNAILSTMPDQEKKIINTGNPRVDLLKEKNRQIYLEEINNIKNKYGNFNLYASSFHKFNAVGNSKNSNWIKETLKAGLMKKEHYEHNLTVNQMQKENLEKTLEFFKQYEKQDALPKLIIKPHPAEDTQVYKKLIKNFKNIILIEDHISIVPWILACNFFISYNSTAQIESSLLGKKPINLEFIRDKNLVFEITRLVSENINTLNEVFNYLRNKNVKQNISEKVNLYKNLSKSIYNIDDKVCSVENICNNLSINKLHKFQNDFKMTKLNFFYMRMNGRVNNIKIFIKNLLSKKNRELYEMTKNKNPGISFKEVESTIKMLNNIYQFKDIKVKEILPSLYSIEKK